MPEPGTRYQVVVFLIVHGLIHVIGFLTATLGVEMEEISEGPSLLITGLVPGSVGMKALGVVWLLSMVGFTAAGIGVLPEASEAAGIARFTASG